MKRPPLNAATIIGGVIGLFLLVCVIGLLAPQEPQPIVTSGVAVESPAPDPQPPAIPSPAPTPARTSAAPDAADHSVFRPEMLVQFPESAPACVELDELREAMLRGARGEKTKMMAMFIDADHLDRTCLMLSRTKKYKVISVQDNAEMPELGLLEIVGADNTSGTGAWALQLGAKPVRQP